MAILDFSGDFLNVKSSKDGDIATILTECTFAFREGLNKEANEMLVEVNGHKKTYAPSNQAGLDFQKAWGLDSKDWIGRQFQILHASGKMAIRPIKETKI